MSENRFNFLEFEGEGNKVSEADQAADIDNAAGPPILIPFAQRSSDGTAMAEVARPERDPIRQIPITFTLETLPDETKQQPARPTVKTLRVVEVFGDRGQKAGQFNYPTGIALDRTGILFVADSYNHRIQRITPDCGVSVIGSRGAGYGEFLFPQAIATDIYSAFYVVEQGNHRVQKFSAEGVIELVFGRFGNKPGEFKGPTGIAIASSGDILIADTGNNRVQRFNAQGQCIAVIGGRADKFPGLSSPQAIAIDTADNLYVADTFANKVARFDPMGRFLGHYGDQGVPAKTPGKRGKQEFNEPRALAVDTAGLLYVADLSVSGRFEFDVPGRVRILETETGISKTTLEMIGHGLGGFARPSGLTVSVEPQKRPTDKKPAEYLYTADTANHRILRFAWK